ncbi:phosphonate ABC transporter, permease protein PhnE [Texcoconibacillus texcoconensis]|uniref:Phosphonate transport system permease protein n=1 Tax=Texcoconibacillus texcoconensis TaxID=1095777 RepID=A0A840QT49_9BACI|nr:phosphonate ABC transporter, permease protein PhnE [Texcoconibacillus texcoconensis]MBB5174447.1 phosphonate transport system permease protein [Texcoconibacillus texcoconensis]
MIWFRKRYIFYAGFIIFLTWWSLEQTEFEWAKFQQLSNAFTFINDRILPPDFSITSLLLHEAFVTLAIAFLGTFFALLIALPISFASASNTCTNRLIYTWNRVVLSVLRSVPEIVFGLIFVVVVGLSPFAAVMAVFLHNIGVLGKLISELIEAADEGPHEAMKSVGAKRHIASLFAIVPQIWPNVLSHYFYRFEVAIRTSLVLGFIGGGGLGQQLFNQFQSINYHAMATSIIFIMVLVIAVDLLGSYVRKRVI